MLSPRLFAAAMTLLAAGAVHSGTPDDLSLERWPASNVSFSQPIGIRHANDGSGRVFVIERCGAIRIVEDGTLLPTPFLSVSVSCGGEQGLLGLAFDPDFASNGTFYVSYSAPPGNPNLGSSADHVLARYTVSPPNGNVANPTGTVVMRVPDLASNHNGGDLHFGHDGYLYWSIGDGGPQGDPNGFAQCTGRKKANNNPATCRDTSGSGPNYYLLGKIVRIDPSQTTASAPANYCGATAGQPAQYTVPAGNPFADVGAFPDDCAEIFNWGFRNPFRFSFDRKTGDMLIGDVGQNTYEEVSFQAAGSPGQNFQWKMCEGFHTYPGGAPNCAGPAGSIPPKLAYSHSLGCSITGGYVYRGPIVALQGEYFFADYCSARIWRVGDANPALPVWAYEQLPGTPSMQPYSFGEDELGNLYVTSGGGAVYRFTSDETGVSHPVTPVAGPGGSISPPGVQMVPEGETTSFTVTPDSGFEIASVSGCGGSLAGNTYTTGAITGPCTVTATFSAVVVTYTVTPSAGPGGNISPSTPQQVEEGETIAFTITPAQDYQIAAVTGCGGSLAGNTYTTGPINGDCEVVATFEIKGDLIFENGFELPD